MRKTLKGLAVTGVMAAALPLGVLASTASAAPASASTLPSSPDGIHDARLCSGSSYFEVFDGTYDHQFVPEGAYYINGGIQRHWQERVWWLGFIQVGGYNFSIDCY